MFHRWHFFPLLVPSSNMPIFSGFLFCLTFELLKTCQNLKSFCYSFVILIIFQLLLLTLFSIGIFLAAYGWWWEGGGRGGPKRPPFKSVTHILQLWILAQVYLAQRRIKKYMTHVTPIEFCWHQHFFTGNP